MRRRERGQNPGGHRQGGCPELTKEAPSTVCPPPVTPGRRAAGAGTQGRGPLHTGTRPEMSVGQEAAQRRPAFVLVLSLEDSCSHGPFP